MNSKVAFLVIITLMFMACSNGSSGYESRDTGNTTGSVDVSVGSAGTAGEGQSNSVEIIEPVSGDVFVLGDDVEVLLRFTDSLSSPVSVTVTVGGRETSYTGRLPGSVIWHSGEAKTGINHLQVKVSFNDGGTETHNINLVMLSDVVPERYTYRVINTYNHDANAYTQGLLFHDGFLYESTGQHGRSSLRQVVPETGEVVRSVNLDRRYFGEGLSLYDGRLYQLTWTSGVGFIYDLETFRTMGTFRYQTEGWGLTNDGSHFYMTDGSHYIYLMDPDSFTERDRLQVFDHQGPVDNLNEMEIIDDVIYANVYVTDEIVMIDKFSGKIIGVINLEGVLARQYYHPSLDVLNGVAYDHENGRLFITGKNWPRLFEIELIRE